MKKFLLVLSLLVVMPAFADSNNDLLYREDVNMTPQRTFSGYTNSNQSRTKYPQLNGRNFYSSSYEQQKAQMMKPKSVKEINSSNYVDTPTTSRPPMTFSQFPQTMTNEDMMHVNAIQNGVQNMYMNF